MTAKPIIFSGPMVRAILAGTKTRRKLYARKGEDPCAPEHLARRLASGLASIEEGKCWTWNRTTNGAGYGTLTVASQSRYAHRLAYELAKGAIPKGLHVMHSCDNPACINPDHLEVGTRSKNMADCHARGRSRIPKPILRGEQNGAAKLTSSQVDDIKRRVANGETQQSIAETFGVSQTLISAIKRGRLWR